MRKTHMNARIAAYIALAAFLSSSPGQTRAQNSLQAGIESVLQQEAAQGSVGSSVSTHTITRPAQVRYELGAVVDVRGADPGGPQVIAVTPGGAAGRMGILPGDRLLRINGTVLTGATDNAARLPKAIASAGGKLDVAVSRNGRTLAMAGTADAVGVPAYTLVVGEQGRGACGYVSSRNLPPRSRNLYPATITRIDGRSTPGSADGDRFRLAAGQHLLVISEHLDQAHMSSSQIAQIAKLKQFTFSPTYKPLVVNVQPGYHYWIASRLIPEKMDTQGIRANAYWEPVVWETRAERCQ